MRRFPALSILGLETQLRGPGKPKGQEVDAQTSASAEGFGFKVSGLRFRV